MKNALRFALLAMIALCCGIVGAWADICPPGTDPISGETGGRVVCQRRDNGAKEVYRNSYESCPLGYRASNDVNGVKSCVLLPDLDTHSERGKKKPCALGTIAVMDTHGQRSCVKDRRVSAHRAYQSDNICPIGTFAVMDAQGEPVCKQR